MKKILCLCLAMVICVMSAACVIKVTGEDAKKLDNFIEDLAESASQKADEIAESFEDKFGNSYSANDFYIIMTDNRFDEDVKAICEKYNLTTVDDETEAPYYHVGIGEELSEEAFNSLIESIKNEPNVFDVNKNYK